MVCRIALGALALLFASVAATGALAQSRKPTVAEVASVRNCAVKNQDDPEKAMQE